MANARKRNGFLVPLDAFPFLTKMGLPHPAPHSCLADVTARPGHEQALEVLRQQDLLTDAGLRHDFAAALNVIAAPVIRMELLRRPMGAPVKPMILETDLRVGVFFVRDAHFIHLGKTAPLDRAVDQAVSLLSAGKPLERHKRIDVSAVEHMVLGCLAPLFETPPITAAALDAQLTAAGLASSPPTCESALEALAETGWLLRSGSGYALSPERADLATLLGRGALIDIVTRAFGEQTAYERSVRFLRSGASMWQLSPFLGQPSEDLPQEVSPEAALMGLLGYTFTPVNNQMLLEAVRKYLCLPPPKRAKPASVSLRRGR